MKIILKKTGAYENPEAQRLDAWLKISCLFKTRTSATVACQRRLVKVNDVTSKASKPVHAGDEIVVRRRGKYRSFRVLGISKRSVSKKMARELYEETTNSNVTPEQQELMNLSVKSSKRYQPKYKGRPTKKSHRELMKLKYRT